MPIVTLQSTKPINHLPNYYVSCTIDFSQVIGYDWWDKNAKTSWSHIGHEKTHQFDFTNKKLISAVKTLTPLIISFGGTKADQLTYFRNEKNSLTKQHVDNMFAFIKKTQAIPMLTVSAGIKQRNNNCWTSENTEELLLYCKKKNYNIPFFTLGNEVNWFLFHGISWWITARSYAKDYNNAKKTVQKYFPQAKLSGPATAMWPIIGDPTLFTKRIHKRAKLDIMSVHFYPTQSQRSPIKLRKATKSISVACLDEATKQLQKVTKKGFWLTETAHALCGGQPAVSDRFCAGIWFVDQLGAMAQIGCQTVIKQTLCGANYGIIEEKTNKPLPDFWNMLLWKGVMGSKVYQPAHKNKGKALRMYIHSISKKHPKYTKQGKSVLLLNIGKKQEQVAIDKQLGKTTYLYEVTAKNLVSKKVEVNGRQLSYPAISEIKHIPAKKITGNIITLKPNSYSFIIIT